MTEEGLHYNALAIATGGNYKRLTKLLSRHQSWKTAYEYLRAAKKIHIDPEKAADALRASSVKLILYKDPGYPAPLRHIPHPPHALYIIGTIPPSRKIAIVGTRKATPQGGRTAKMFGQEIAAAGCAIVSGLAFGIDAAAHEGALDAGGACVAVLAGGLRRLHPATNARLGIRIAERGAIISEYPLDEPPFKDRFLERNRIVSGLSEGVVVIEAPQRSGSLATARFAAEQNRDLFVVPGSILHPNFEGSHALIRQGAELVTSPAEILEAYGMEKGGSARRAIASASREETLILEALRAADHPLDIDKLAAMTKLQPHIATQTISFLFIKDLVREAGTGYTIN